MTGKVIRVDMMRLGGASGKERGHNEEPSTRHELHVNIPPQQVPYYAPQPSAPPASAFTPQQAQQIAYDVNVIMDVLTRMDRRRAANQAPPQPDVYQLPLPQRVRPPAQVPYAIPAPAPNAPYPPGYNIEI
jgi:hypothetical protein